MRARPHDDTRRFVTNEPGKTDGTFSLGVSPAQSTRKPRKHRVSRSPDIDPSYLNRIGIPSDALIHLNGNARIKLVTYSRGPIENALDDDSRKDSHTSSSIGPHPNLVKRIPPRTNGR